MPNMEALTQAIGGVDPKQAQQMTSTIIGALQNQQQMENQQQYKQQRLNLMRDKEQRMAEQAKFDRTAKFLTLKMEKQMHDLKKELTEKRQKFTKAQRNYKQEQINKVQSKARTLKNMNQEMSIPGTDDSIKAGAAIQAGIFGDLIQENVSSTGMSFGDLPTNVQEFEYLRNNLNMEESEALKKAGLTGKGLKNLMSAMKMIQMRNPEKAKELLNKLKDVNKEKSENETEPETGTEPEADMDKAINDSLTNFRSQ